MARMPLSLTLTLLLSMPLMGCVRFGQSPERLTVVPMAAADAPRVHLPLEPKSPISTVSSRTTPVVSVVDSRPEIEKLYYPGQTDPHHWRDAVTILPMESFQPELAELLEQQLTTILQDASQYESLVCEVTSFQVALDERERSESDLLYRFKTWDDDRVERDAAEERERQRDDEFRSERVRCGHEDEEKSVGDAVAGFVFNALVVHPIKSEMTSAERDRKTTVQPQMIPVSLTEGKQSGWNCQMSVILRGRKTDGNQFEVPMQVESHQPKDDSFTVESQMQGVVLAVVREFGQKAAAAGL